MRYEDRGICLPETERSRKERFRTVYSNKKSRSIDVPRLLCEIAGIKNA